MNITERIVSFKQEFDPLFMKEVGTILKEHQNFYTHSKEYDSFLRKTLFSYIQGGKRIRPFFIKEFSEKRITTKVLQDTCIAVELFHLAALIHDDIMDNAETRRNVPTLHKAFEKFSKKNKSLGSDIALLLGDVFLIAAIQKAASLPHAVSNEFMTMVKRTVSGQYLDALGMNKSYGDISKNEIFERYRLKTAWYTFASPARLGLLLRNKGEKKYSLEKITEKMIALGVLFQIKDDILDCSQQDSGKDMFTDILENQTTWVTLFLKKNAPTKIAEIKAAATAKNIKMLEGIFRDIDVITPYRKEYQRVKKEMMAEGDKKIKLQTEEILELLSI